MRPTLYQESPARVAAVQRGTARLPELREGADRDEPPPRASDAGRALERGDGADATRPWPPWAAPPARGVDDRSLVRAGARAGVRTGAPSIERAGDGPAAGARSIDRAGVRLIARDGAGVPGRTAGALDVAPTALDGRAGTARAGSRRAGVALLSCRGRGAGVRTPGAGEAERAGLRLIPEPVGASAEVGRAPARDGAAGDITRDCGAGRDAGATAGPPADARGVATRVGGEAARLADCGCAPEPTRAGGACRDAAIERLGDERTAPGLCAGSVERFVTRGTATDRDGADGVPPSIRVVGAAGRIVGVAPAVRADGGLAATGRRKPARGTAT